MIRPYGESQIEIIVPEVDQREVDRIKRKVEEAGILRFAIVANQADHQPEINLAVDQARVERPRDSNAAKSSVTQAERWLALWAVVDREIR